MNTGRKLMLDVGVICEELGLRKDYIENVVKKNGGMKPGAREAEDEQGDGEKDGEKDEEDKDRKDADKRKEKETDKKLGEEERLELGLKEGREQGLVKGLEESEEQGPEQRTEHGQTDFSALSDNEGLPSRNLFRFSVFMEGVGS
ncbi:hypothetical protein [Paenibacillus sp. GbtcB18]|uniref:hypothetical protein n=1 Tax=Paenibacillus sp. GbtcB18 TaxID=2824763 RepID=UPI0020C6F833|nr:hypothetical protein [Paenibacillus sp. GbtcB18]